MIPPTGEPLEWYSPLAHALQLGLTIEYVPLKDRDGEYRHDLKRIRLRPGMRPALERSVLAHEVAHAELAHTADGDRAAQEAEADNLAAERLIPHAAIVQLAQSSTLVAAARQLGVTSTLLGVYVYAHPELAEVAPEWAALAAQLAPAYDEHGRRHRAADWRRLNEQSKTIPCASRLHSGRPAVAQ